MSRFARVVRLYKKGGAPVCDISDTRSGSLYLGCPFSMPGAGTKDRGSVRLPAQDSLVAYIPYGGNSPGAVIVGSVLRPEVGARFRQEGAPAVDYSRDYPTVVELDDSLEFNGGACWILTSDGQIVLDTTESGGPVRVQLEAGGVLRISQGGREPTERLMLAGPTRNKLDQLVGAVNELKGQVAFLTAALSAGASPTSASFASVATGIADKPYAPLPVASTSAEVEAGAILISDQSTEV